MHTLIRPSSPEYGIWYYQAELVDNHSLGLYNYVHIFGPTP